MNGQERNHYDVTGSVRISHPAEVKKAVCRLLSSLYPGADLSVLDRAFKIFTKLHAGALPGYAGCDTWYHDAQHGLDCALATTRLIDGHERHVVRAHQLGAERAQLGVVIALFHDAGYIRREGDNARNGAEYTLTHVERSAEFLALALPRLGMAAQVELARRLVHYTGFEVPLDRIEVDDPRDRMLGFLVATADLLSQTADRCYLEKCRDFLYRELEFCGMAGSRPAGKPAPAYRSAEELLARTAEFNQRLWTERLDGFFGGAYHYMALHFGGMDPYLARIQRHLRHITELGQEGRYDRLRRQPRVIGASHMRRLDRQKCPALVSPGFGAATA